MTRKTLRACRAFFEALETRKMLSLTAPTISSVTMTSERAGQTVEARVNWGAVSGADRYILQNSSDGITWGDLSEPYFSSPGYDPLGAGQDRFYRVKAQDLNASGQVIDESGWSNEVSPITDFDKSVLVSAYVDDEQIVVTWPDRIDVDTYSVFRKERSDRQWTPLVEDAEREPGIQTYFDNSTAAGDAYEYRVELHSSIVGNINGSVYAGVEAPLTDHRGTILVLVDHTRASALESELALLTHDLAGEGWTVQVRTDVPRENDSTTSRPNVTLVKQMIKSVYDDTNEGL